MNNIIVKSLNLNEGEMSQGFNRIPIFNETNTQSNSISLEYVILHKGVEAVPHLHDGTYSVVFTLKGKAKIYFGENLNSSVEVGVQDSVYIPPNVVHYVVNEYEEEMIAVVARTPSKHKIIEFGNIPLPDNGL